MGRKILCGILIALSFVLGASVGKVLERTLYEDRCLDLGGGMQPGGHPICVIEKE
jgi:predicted Na+-dependent transporter